MAHACHQANLIDVIKLTQQAPMQNTCKTCESLIAMHGTGIVIVCKTQHMACLVAFEQVGGPVTGALMAAIASFCLLQFF